MPSASGGKSRPAVRAVGRGAYKVRLFANPVKVEHYRPRVARRSNGRTTPLLAAVTASATPAIALLAAVIGVMQWRTAHQRAVLDLFQRRLDAYTEIKIIIGELLREGTAPTALILRYAKAIDAAKFLFGPEVSSYLQGVYQQLTELHRAQSSMKMNDKNHDKWVDKEADVFGEITEFYKTIEPLVTPYMRMHQRVPWF
jgi:hypothetical protein